MVKKTFKEKLKALDSVTEISTSKGNYDANPYMWGMANGLILAQAIMKDETPAYLDRPEFISLEGIENATSAQESST